MSQKSFKMDAGIKLGEWSFSQDSNGDLVIGPNTAFPGSQKPFHTDAGFKIGDTVFHLDGDDIRSTDGAVTLPQAPFRVDGGVAIGDWELTIDSNGAVVVALSSVTSSTSTTLSGGEGFATGYASTEWQTAADSATGNPRIIINTHYPTLDSGWKTALDNWAVGDTLVIKTPIQFEDTTLTTTGGISSTVSGDYKQYFFDVDVAHSSSVYVYQVEHTT